MQKGKLVIWLLGYSVALFWLARPAWAANISITQLSSYITSNSFKLSYSCLGCTSVQFYVSKHGGSWTAFGPAMSDASGQVQVTDLQVNEQTDYSFKVVDAGVGEATTSTFYDISGPSPVSGYYKERIDDGTYKLHWVNPGDSDFAKVIIYRGDVAGFSADGSHLLAEVGGGANSPMTFDDHFAPDAGKNYLYLIRAIDKAGNSSSLVGDGGGTVTVTTTPKPGTAGEKVTVLPAEGQGEVLPAGTQAPQPTTAPQGVVQKAAQFAKNRTKLTVLILAGIGLVGYLLYRKLRKS